MFEKEAEEYYEDVTIGTFQECTENFADAVLTAYKDGAEFGYNKANEWYYTSKGEYPKENKRYLCKIKAFVGGGISYECFDYDTEYGSWKDASGDVIAWRDFPEYFQKVQ